jgi:hypothetical protein
LQFDDMLDVRVLRAGDWNRCRHWEISAHAERECMSKGRERNRT